jgi:aminoglycoside 3-N-acetyltransferase
MTEPSPTEPRPAVSRAEVAQALARLGLRRGDVLLVHSALGRLGRVDGGPDAVIDALLAAVGPDGLVIMPTFTSCRVTPERPEPEPYDPRATSCRSRTGIVPDTFWRRPGARRSLHPTHSLVAIGPRADEFAAGGETRTFDPAGPFGRYVRWGGRALFLGAGLGSNTTCHCAEDWLGMPFLTDETCLVRGPDGAVRRAPVSGCPTGNCRTFYANGGNVREALEREGAVRLERLGAGELRLVAARDVIRAVAEGEERAPGWMLFPDHADAFCRDGIAGCRAQRERILAKAAALRAAGWVPPET